MDNELRDILNMGVVIPASPLALDSDRKLDERRLRAIYRYYGDSGCRRDSCRGPYDAVPYPRPGNWLV